jgi:hypothetical protein
MSLNVQAVQFLVKKTATKPNRTGKAKQSYEEQYRRGELCVNKFKIVRSGYDKAIEAALFPDTVP